MVNWAAMSRNDALDRSQGQISRSRADRMDQGLSTERDGTWRAVALSDASGGRPADWSMDDNGTTYRGKMIRTLRTVIQNSKVVGEKVGW